MVAQLAICSAQYSGLMDREDLVPALARLVPADRLLTRAGALASYESDGLTAYRARPRAVVLAESADEIIATVRACHAARVPFMARGSGTSLSGGAVPVEDGIVIALNRMNRVLRFDPAARLAVVQPGVQLRGRALLPARDDGQPRARDARRAGGRHRRDARGRQPRAGGRGPRR